MSTEQLKLINAALSRTSNNQITSLTDGSAEAEVAAANYEEIVLEVLSSYPWNFAKKEIELNRLAQTPGNEWKYVYQSPSDLLEIVRVFQNGKPVAYEKNRTDIYTNTSNSEQPLYCEYTVRIAEEEWPGQFRAAIIERLESLFLRALNEEYEYASSVEQNADITARLAKNRDGVNKTPRRVRQSKLVRVRQSGPRYTT